MSSFRSDFENLNDDEDKQEQWRERARAAFDDIDNDWVPEYESSNSDAEVESDLSAQPSNKTEVVLVKQDQQLSESSDRSVWASSDDESTGVLELLADCSNNDKEDEKEGSSDGKARAGAQSLEDSDDDEAGDERQFPDITAHHTCDQPKELEPTLDVSQSSDTEQDTEEQSSVVEAPAGAQLKDDKLKLDLSMSDGKLPKKSHLSLCDAVDFSHNINRAMAKKKMDPTEFSDNSGNKGADKKPSSVTGKVLASARWCRSSPKLELYDILEEEEEEEEKTEDEAETPQTHEPGVNLDKMQPLRELEPTRQGHVMESEPCNKPREQLKSDDNPLISSLQQSTDMVAECLELHIDDLLRRNDDLNQRLKASSNNNVALKKANEALERAVAFYSDQNNRLKEEQMEHKKLILEKETLEITVKKLRLGSLRQKRKLELATNAYKKLLLALQKKKKDKEASAIAGSQNVAKEVMVTSLTEEEKGENNGTPTGDLDHSKSSSSDGSVKRKKRRQKKKKTGSSDDVMTITSTLPGVEQEVSKYEKLLKETMSLKKLLDESYRSREDLMSQLATRDQVIQEYTCRNKELLRLLEMSREPRNEASSRDEEIVELTNKNEELLQMLQDSYHELNEVMRQQRDWESAGDNKGEDDSKELIRTIIELQEEDFKKEKLELENTIVELETSLCENRKQLEDSQEEKLVLERMLEDSTKGKEQLQLDLESCREVIHEYKISSEKLVAEKEKLASSLQQTSEDLSNTLRREQDASQAKICSLEGEVKRLERMLEDSASEKDQLHLDMESHNDMIQEYMKSSGELKTENEKLARSLEESKAMKEDLLKQHETEMEKKQKSLDKLLCEHLNLVSALQQTKRASEDLSMAHQKKRGALEAKICGLEEINSRLDRELDNKEQEVLHLETEKNQLTELNEKMAKERKELGRSVEESKKAVEELVKQHQREMADEQESFDKLRSEHHDLISSFKEAKAAQEEAERQHRNEMDNQVKSMEKLFSEQQKLISILEQTKHTSEDLCKTHMREQEALQAKIRDLEDANNRLVREVEDERQERANLETEKNHVLKLNKQMVKDQEELNSTIEQSEQATEVQSQIHQKQQAALEGKICDLEGNSQKLSRELDNKEQELVDLKAQKAEVLLLNKQMVKEKEELSRSKMALEELLEQHQSEISVRETSLEKLQSEHQDLLSTLDQTKQASENLSLECQKQKMFLETKICDLEDENKRLASAVDEARISREELVNQHQKDLEDRQKSMDELLTEHCSLLSTVDQTEQTSKNLCKENQEETESLKKKILDLEVQNKRLAGMLEDSTKDKEVLKQDKESWNMKSQECMALNDKLRAQLKKTVSELKSAKKAHRGVCNQLFLAESENAIMSDTLKFEKETHKESREKLVTANTECSRLSLDLQEVSLERDTAKKICDKLTQEIEEYSTRLQKVKIEKNQMERQECESSYKLRLEEMENEKVQSLEMYAAALESNVRQRIDLFEELKAMYGTLKANRDIVAGRVMDLSKELESLYKDHSNLQQRHEALQVTANRYKELQTTKESLEQSHEKMTKFQEASKEQFQELTKLEREKQEWVLSEHGQKGDWSSSPASLSDESDNLTSGIGLSRDPATPPGDQSMPRTVDGEKDAGNSANRKLSFE